MGFHSLKYALMALLMLLSLATGAVAAVQVRVMPPAPSGVVGSTITVTIEADSVRDLGGFQFGFSYSTADLEALSATINPAFDQLIAQDLGATTGSGMIAAAVFDNVTVTGNLVPLATINFKILKPVTTSISLTTVILGQIGGTEIPSSAVGGTVVGTATSSKTNQTLSFGAAPTVVVGGTGTVSAIASSGLAVSYASTTPDICTIAGGTVTGVAAGTCTIAADQAGSTTYNSAAQVTQNIIIPAPVNGVCGARNGGVFTAAPTADLCTTGTATSVTGSGPWSWSCGGINGGTPASCSAAIDITGPVLTVSTLGNGAITNTATLNISGTISDSSAVAGLTINNAAVSVTNGTFSAVITLQEGLNTVTVIAADALGNSASNSRTLTLDSAAPILTVTAPADNSTTAQAVVMISGTINETSTVTVSVNNGTPQSASLTGSAYSTAINLAVGLNSITITATDLAGNTASAMRTVTYDNTKPSLAITNPNQDITTADSSLTILGSVSDNISSATVSILFNDHTYTPVITNSIFSQQLAIPREGTWPVTATATDAAGNSSSVVRNIIYAIPVNGVCGSSNGATFTVLPTTNLCATGAAAQVSGTGPWNWSCGGTNGGIAASCSAGLTAAALDTIAPVVTSFIISATSATRTVPVSCLIATDAVAVTGYLLSESATVPLLSDPAWSASAQSAFTCSTWGNKTIYAYARDAAGNISDAKSSNVYIGIAPEVDGVIVDAQGKIEPLLADALMSLKFAMKLEFPNTRQMSHGRVAPLVNGVPQPDPNRTELNLGDTIVILRRVVGL